MIQVQSVGGEFVLRFLFLVQRPESWINLEGLHSALLRRQKCECAVWILPYDIKNPRLSERKALETKALLSSAAIEANFWEPRDSERIHLFDVVLVGSPFERERHRSLRLKALKGKCRLVVFVPYGLSLGSGFKQTYLQYLQPAHLNADIVLARSGHDRDQYSTARGAPAENVYITGLPRLDSVLASLRAEDALSEPNEAESLPVLLWCTHFSVAPEYAHSASYSTLDLLGPSVFEWMRKNPGRLKVIWRPHPKTADELARLGIVPLSAWDELKSELLSIGIEVDLAPDHIESFRRSSALLTDVGSFLLEYAVTGNPICAAIDPYGEQVNAEGQALLAKVLRVRSGSEVEAFLEALSESRVPPLSPDVCGEHLPLCDGHAADRVIALMFAHLGVPVPQLRDDDVQAPRVGADARPAPSIHHERVPSASASTPKLDYLAEKLGALRQRKVRHGPVYIRIVRLAKRVRNWAAELAKQALS